MDQRCLPPSQAVPRREDFLVSMIELANKGRKMLLANLRLVSLQIFGVLLLIGLTGISSSAQTPREKDRREQDPCKEIRSGNPDRDQQFNDEAHFFATQAPIVVSGAGDTLGVALPLVNCGKETVFGVSITALKLRKHHRSDRDREGVPPRDQRDEQESGDDETIVDLIAPKTFPVSIGDVPPLGLLLVQATFDGAGLHVGTKDLLTVRGTYVFGGQTFLFTVHRLVTIPGPPSFFLGVNKTDQLLLEARAANGDVIDYFGPKDGNGLAMGLDTVLVQTRDGLFRYNLDRQARPVQVFGADGTTITMNWSSATSVLVTAISADGTRHVAFPIDLSNHPSGQVATGKVSPASIGSIPSGQTLRASSSRISTLDLAAVRLSRLAPSSGTTTRSLRNCSLTSSPGSAAARLIDTNIGTDVCGKVACVKVNRCGPADNADVKILYNGVHPYPGTLTKTGTGTYGVPLPSPAAEIASAQEGCTNAAEFLGGVCNFAKLLGAICGDLVQLGFQASLPCVALLEPLITACEINGGRLTEGGPDINQAFCSFVTNTLDLVVSGPVSLLPEAFISDVGLTLGSSTETNSDCPDLGTCPTMSVSFPGGVPGIDSISRIVYDSPLIDLLPQNSFPRGGTYWALVRGSCLSAATDFLTNNPAVAGRLLSVSDAGLTVQISSTAVPENQTQQAPIPSVGFSLLSGGQPFVNSGLTTFDIVTGFAPQVTSFRVTNGVTAIPKGTPTVVAFSDNILDSGNVRFFYVGCGNCVIQFGQATGTQFETTLPFSAVVTIPSNSTATSFGIEVGAVDGAGQGGVTGNDPGSPASLQIPIIP